MQVFNTGTKTDIVKHFQNVNDPIPYLRNINNLDDLSIVVPQPTPYSFQTKERMVSYLIKKLISIV